MQYQRSANYLFWWKGGGNSSIVHCYYFLVIKQVIQKVYAAGIFLKCKLWMKCRFIIMFLCKTRFKLSFRRCLSDIKNISFIYKNKSTPYTIHDFSSFLSNFGFSLKENKNFDLCSWILNKCCLLLRRKITTLCDRVYQLLELEKVFLILCKM